MEYSIPRGKISTYARIAAALGMPRGARAVGYSLANNPFPLVIPCHRAVRSDGTLGGFQGGLSMKRALLECEGIPFTVSGRVDWERAMKTDLFPETPRTRENTETSDKDPINEKSHYL
jgi:methylated-DNA-[protein]-cysteine S-methyltransferase